MLDKSGFDQWADGYDETVGLSDRNHTYPFAGYQQVLAYIRRQVTAQGPCSVLDLGFGTGTLTSQLYSQGCSIWGMDFSPKMREAAQAKMPGAPDIGLRPSHGVSLDREAVAFPAESTGKLLPRQLWGSWVVGGNGSMLAGQQSKKGSRGTGSPCGVWGRAPRPCALAPEKASDKTAKGRHLAIFKENG